MADINDLKIKLQKVRQDLLNGLPEMSVSNTTVARTLIERNIRDIGFGAVYSSNKLPAWFFWNKGKTEAGKQFVKDKIKKDEKNTHVQDGVKYYSADDGMAWKDLRQVEGLPIDHVNLSFTNRMWIGLRPLDPFYKGQIIICPLGSQDKDVNDKLNFNRARYGDFLGKVLGEKELEIMSAALMDRVRLIFKNNGF